MTETPTTASANSSSVPERQCLDVCGRKIYLDADGFLWDAQDWSEEVAACMARASGLEGLSESHWRVLRFIREFYLDTGRAPRNRRLRQGTGLSLLEVESLFPQGIRLGAARLAGLPASVKGLCD